MANGREVAAGHFMWKASPGLERPVKHECELDVSHLEPPEPMEKILEAISALHPGQYLRVLIHRDPIPLYPILEREGFERITCLGVQSEFELIIWRSSDESATQAVKSACEGSSADV